MVFEGMNGKIKMLRVNDLGHVWGPPNDAIFTEVTIQLDIAPDMGFGFELRTGDDNLPARLAMLSVLKDAYIHGIEIAIGYDIVEGKKNGHLRRVELSKPKYYVAKDMTKREQQVGVPIMSKEAEASGLKKRKTPSEPSKPRPHPMFKKAMETKYAKEWGSNKCGSIAKSKITDKKTKYLRLGYTQNPRKVEMAKCGAAATKKRGPINPTK